MLDQDEFQEMLKTMSDQTTGDEPSKLSNGMDTIGGMQLASKFTKPRRALVSHAHGHFSFQITGRASRQSNTKISTRTHTHTHSLSLSPMISICLYLSEFNEKECFFHDLIGLYCLAYIFLIRIQSKEKKNSR